MSKARLSLLVMMLTGMIVLMLLTRPYTPAVAVRTTVVKTGELVKSMRLSGTVGYSEQQLCISPYDGRISHVHVQQGQRVRAGELLFQLDTEAEEQLLAELLQMNYQQKNGLPRLDASVGSFLSAKDVDWLKTQLELKQRIQLAGIRSEADGVVEMVQVRNGELVPAKQIIGVVRGDQKCVRTAAVLPALKIESVAVMIQNGTELGMAFLERMEHTESDQLVFVPFHEAALSNVDAGDVVAVEAVTESWNNVSLIPLAAVSETEEVWVVRDGRAYPAKIDISKRNDDYVALAPDWEGETLVLLPDMLSMSEGCRVKTEEH